MKQLITAAIAFLALFISAPLVKADWVKLADEGDVTLYTDSEVTRENGNYLFWIKAEFNTPEKRKETTETLSSEQTIYSMSYLTVFDSNWNKSRIGAVSYGGESGDIIETSTYDESEMEFQYITPGSMEDILRKIAKAIYALDQVSDEEEK